MVSMRSDTMMGRLCERGGRFLISRTMCLCVLMRGCRYCAFALSVPQMEISPMRCGKI